MEEETFKGGLFAKYLAKLREAVQGMEGPFLYRGQKDAGWELASGATQRIKQKSIKLSTLLEYHNSLLEPARLRGWGTDSVGRRLSDLELLAKLQHHGAATCLLDFTTSFNIALWFACQEAGVPEISEGNYGKPGNGKVFVVPFGLQVMQVELCKVRSNELDEPIGYFLCPHTRRSEDAGNEPSHMAKVAKKEPRMEKRTNEQRVFLAENEKTRFWYWDPEILMERMVSQVNRFLFGFQDIPQGAYITIEIVAEDKQDLLEELELQQGLRAESIFSDIHGFAYANSRGDPWQTKSGFDYIREGLGKTQEADFFGAIQDFDKAIEIDPEDTVALFNRGNAKTSLERHEEAVRDFDKAIELEPGNSAACNNRGMAKLFLRRYEEAIQDFDRAISLEPDNAVALVYRGNAKAYLGRHEETIRDYDTAISLKPDYAVALVYRGNTKAYLERYEEAIRDYDTVIELEPENAATWHSRGNAKAYLGRHEEAIRDFDTAIELEPENAATWHSRGNAKAYLGRHEEAIRDYDTAISLEPENATAWLNRGNAVKYVGRYEEAIQDFGMAIELDPEQSVAWQDRGNTKAYLGRHAEAIRDFDTAIELEPENAAAWFYRAIARSSLKRYEEAIQDFNKAIELEPEHVLAWSNLGVARACLERNEEALQDFDNAIKLDPEDAGVWYWRGQTRAKIHRFEEARKDLLRARCLYENQENFEGLRKTREALQEFAHPGGNDDETASLVTGHFVEGDKNTKQAYKDV